MGQTSYARHNRGRTQGQEGKHEGARIQKSTQPYPTCNRHKPAKEEGKERERWRNQKEAQEVLHTTMAAPVLIDGQELRNDARDNDHQWTRSEQCLGRVSPPFSVQLSPPVRDQHFSLSGHFVPNPATHFTSQKNEMGHSAEIQKKRKYNSVEQTKSHYLRIRILAELSIGIL